MTRAALVLALLAALAGCGEERRVIAVRGGLHDLPGAEGGVQIEKPLVASKAERQRASMQNPRGYADAGEQNDLLRVAKPGGRVTLVSRNARELAFHLRQTLARDEIDLLYEQVISDRTKDRYEEAGLDPREAATFLMKHKDEVLRLIQNLHLAERLPMDLGDVIGPNEYELRVPPGQVDPPLRFNAFDYVFERDACRLLLLR